MTPMLLVITLLAVGAVLLLIETVLPGMIVGLIGVGCLVAGVVTGYLTLDIETAHLVLLGVLGGLTVGTLLWFKYFPDSRMARMLIAHGTVGDLGTERPELLNQNGKALTPLRPSGAALINGRRVDVVTEGGFVNRDTPVRVVAIEGMRVVVRAINGA